MASECFIHCATGVPMNAVTSDRAASRSPRRRTKCWQRGKERRPSMRYRYRLGTPSQISATKRWVMNEQSTTSPSLSLPLLPPFLPVSSPVPLYFLSLLISLNGIFSFSGEYFFAYVLHASFCIYVTCLLIYNAGAEFCEI